MGKIKSILYFVLYWLIYIGLVQRYMFRHELLALVPDILIFYTAYLTYKKRKKKPTRKYIGKTLPVLIITLFLCSLIGVAINIGSLGSYLWGIRMIIRYPLLLWVIFQNFESSDAENYKKIIYRAFEINILFCLIQKVLTPSGDGDSIGGTFTGNELLMLLACITSFISIGDYFNKNLSRTKFYCYVASLLLIAILAEIKMMYFLFPLIIYGGYVLVKRFSLNHVIVLILAFLFLIPAMQYVMSFYYDEGYVERVFDIESMEKEASNPYGFHEGGFNRATAIELANETMLTDTPRKLFGYGLGSGSKSSIFSTSIYYKYYYTSYWNFSTSYCLVEMGWVGFILYLSCFACLLYRFWIIYIRVKDPVLKYWSAVGLLSVATTFLLFWYNDNVYFKYLPVYFLWGVCFAAIECRRKEIVVL